MEGFCPLCMKKDLKRKMKAYQINLTEAMWSCEEEMCCWPIGYEELVFFNRPAESLLEPSSVSKEDVALFTELSLYTPPVTPGSISKELTEIECSSNSSVEDKLGGILPKCESFTSTKESIDSNKLFEHQSEINNSTKEREIISKNEIASINSFKLLPKITNIQKANINFTVLSNVHEHCNSTKVQKCQSSFEDTSAINNFEGSDVFESTCKELDVQCKSGNEQNENGTVQLNAITSGMETNLGTDIPPDIMQTLVDVNSTNSSSTQESIINACDSDINTLLEGILADDNMTADVNTDWLMSLLS
ncbi:hypothetical protein P5V15_010743 [Pogonomyrmex californicus]